jgi:hypothetical protein
MPLFQLRNVNFGSRKANATGSLGVGYTLLDETGVVEQIRTTTGVYQLTSGSGMYAAYISFPSDFRGQILWDTGTAFNKVYYATEQYNVEENDPKIAETLAMVSSITGSIQLLRDMTAGRWIIENNQMKFYKEDNVTLVATFDLYDDTNVPTMDSVFERVKI